jgi:hypothetical protein
MDPGVTHASGLFQGTLSHMAPEVMLQGKLSKSVDVYAFGIFLWEIFTASMPFKGINYAHLGHAITVEKMRPEWPKFCPQDLKGLAERCWSDDPDLRPTFDDIYLELVEMRKKDKSKTPPVKFVPQSKAKAEVMLAPSVNRLPAALAISNDSVNIGSFSIATSDLSFQRTMDKASPRDSKWNKESTRPSFPPPAPSGSSAALIIAPGILLGDDLSPAASGDIDSEGTPNQLKPFTSIHLLSALLDPVPEEPEDISKK